MEKEGPEKKRYFIFAVVLILAVYAIAYFINPGKAPVYPTIAAVGFIMLFIIFFLVSVTLFEVFLEKKLYYLDKILDDCFVNFIGESIALIFSFFFYITLMASFGLSDSSLVFFQPISFVILSSFNHLHYENSRLIGIFAIIAVFFLFIGFLSSFNSIFLIFTTLSLLLFSAVAYRIFRIEIPAEMQR